MAQPLSLEEFEHRLVKIEARHDELSRRLPSTDLPLGVDLIDLGEVPSAAIHALNDQTIGDGAWTAVSFSTVTWDTDGMADATNNKLTIQRAGIYHVTGQALWSNANATGIRAIKLLVGSIVFCGDSTGGSTDIGPRNSCGVPRYFDAGDIITMEAYHKRGVNHDIMGSTATNNGRQLTATLVADTGDVRTEQA